MGDKHTFESVTQLALQHVSDSELIFIANGNVQHKKRQRCKELTNGSTPTRKPTIAGSFNNISGKLANTRQPARPLTLPPAHSLSRPSACPPTPTRPNQPTHPLTRPPTCSPTHVPTRPPAHPSNPNASPYQYIIGSAHADIWQ